MSYSIDETPIEKYGSEWLAAWNPIIWKFTRKDRDVLVIEAPDAATVVVDMNTTLFTGINQGDKIFVTAGSSGIFHNLILEVISHAGNQVTCVNPDLGVVAQEGAGYANWIEWFADWRMEIRLVDIIDSDNIVSIPTFGSGHNGKTTCDIREYLQAQMELKFQDDYVFDQLNLVNQQDFTTFFKFKINYRESYIDTTDGDRTNFSWSDDVDVYWAVRSGRQIGQNNTMLDFYLDETEPGRFLTPRSIGTQVDDGSQLTKCKYWVGLPFSISFQYNYDNAPAAQQAKSLAFVQVARVVELRDVNRSLIGTDIDALVNYGVGLEAVNHLGLFSVAGATDTTKYLHLYLENFNAPLPTEGYWLAALSPSYSLGGYVTGNI